MNISIIGTGHVGLVSGGCFADLGNRVICMDHDKKKIEGLKRGIIPFYEPGLEEMVLRNVSQKRFSFSTNLKETVRKSQIIFIAVGTPSKENGEADLSYVENVARQVAECMPSYRLIVEKSTVPVETGEWIKHTIHAYKRRKIDFDVASNPEFLREGRAVNDFMHPDRIIIGVESKKAQDLLMKLYKPLNAPILVTDVKSAELIKHASNSFLATKLSFINAIACICEKVGADIAEIAKGMGLDKRIGKDFLQAGIGYGGICLPKDIEAFIHIAKKAGYDFALLEAVRKTNDTQQKLFVKKIEKALWIVKGKTIGVLGLSFKPDTDDLRRAPSIGIIKTLQAEGAEIRAFDPQAMRNAAKLFKNVKFCKDAYEAAKDSDCLVILTEWNEFKELDLNKLKKLLKQPIVIDGRNIYDPQKMKKLGFRYVGLGRGKL